MGLFDMQEEPQTFGQRLKRDFQSGELMDRIALAANTLRMEPDQNLAQMIQIRQERRGEKDTANRTAQWLASQGRDDLAQALMTGALDAKTAVATALTPAADNRTAMIQNYEYWLSQGKTPEEAQALARAGAGGTTVTTALPEQEKAYDKGMGEWAVKTYTGLQDSAASAGDQIANLSRMETLMNDPNFRSGTGTDAIVSMQKLVEALGGNPADVGSIEAFRAASTQAVMASLGGSLGAGFSNADRDFVMSMTANLDNSVQGNKMILSAQKKIAQRKIELARLADQYIAEKGRLDANWPMVMREYAEQNPLFAGAGGAGATDPNSYIPGG
jgi:predicted transcriptional regulator